MFFKALTEKLKHKSGKKYLQQELAKNDAGLTRNKGISAIGVIVDLDLLDKVEVFHELTNDFALRPNGVKIIGYKSFYDKNSPYATPVFSDKDLGWNGKIENSYALEFLSNEFDLLINYYTKDNLLMQLMSIQSKARIKVGFGEVDKNLNDLILNAPKKDFNSFKSELKKYLKILNEIK